MDLHLTPEQEFFIRQAVESGRFATPEQAVADALNLWGDRERERQEILRMVDEAEESLTRGEGITLDKDSAEVFFEDIKRRGRERMGAQKN